MFVVIIMIICLPVVCLAGENDSTKTYGLPDSSSWGFMCLESFGDTTFEVFIDDISIGFIDNESEVTIIITMNEVWQDSTHSTCDLSYTKTDCHGLNFYTRWQFEELKVKVYYNPVQQENKLKELFVFASK